MHTTQCDKLLATVNFYFILFLRSRKSQTKEVHRARLPVNGRAQNESTGMYLSAWQISVRCWKSQGSHTEWSGSVFFFGAVMRVLCWSFAGSEGSTIVCVRLEGDSSMVEEVRGPFGFAACCDFGVAQRWWQRRRCRRLVSNSSPEWGGGDVLCRCVCLCSRVCLCGGVRFARYVSMFLLVKWYSSAPVFI
jgi:hypothetical protein